MDEMSCAIDLEDGWCYVHRQQCSLAPSEDEARMRLLSCLVVIYGVVVLAALLVGWITLHG